MPTSDRSSSEPDGRNRTIVAGWISKLCRYLEAPNQHQPGKDIPMYITTKDGTKIYYKDWGAGRPIVFSHGWPLTADSWESQMFFLASKGFRCVAHDRRGHGRSSQPSEGNEMDTYADDLAALLKHLDLKKVVLVGFSTGGGEVARYIGRHGTKRVAKAVLVSAVPPLMVKTETNPGGLPIEVFDDFRSAFLADRSQFFKDVPSGPFFGFNRPGARVSQGMIDSWWMQGMMGGHKNTYECIKAFSETAISLRTLRNLTCRRSSSTATTIKWSRSMRPAGLLQRSSRMRN
jgi:non-heme chloroperoxidase